MGLQAGLPALDIGGIRGAKAVGYGEFDAHPLIHSGAGPNNSSKIAKEARNFCCRCRSWYASRGANRSRGGARVRHADLRLGKRQVSSPFGQQQFHLGGGMGRQQNIQGAVRRLGGSLAFTAVPSGLRNDTSSMSPSRSSRDSLLPIASYCRRFSMKASGPPQPSGGAEHFPQHRLGTACLDRSARSLQSECYELSCRRNCIRR